MRLVRMNEATNNDYFMQTRIKYGKNNSKSIDVDSTGILSVNNDILNLKVDISLVAKEFMSLGTKYKLKLTKSYKDDSKESRDNSYLDFKDAIEVLHDIISNNLSGFDIVIYEDFDDIMKESFDEFSGKMKEFEVKESHK